MLLLRSFEDDDEMYVAVPFGSSLDPESREYNHVVRFISGKENWNIVRLSKKDYEKALTLDQFISYEDMTSKFEEHFPVQNEEIEKFVYARANMNLIKLRGLKDRIDCPMVNALIGMYPKFDADSLNRRNSRCDRTRYLYEKFYSHYKAANKKMEEITEKEEALCESYPLLNGFMRGYDEQLEEYVYYINEKSKVIRGLKSADGKLKIRMKNAK